LEVSRKALYIHLVNNSVGEYMKFIDRKEEIQYLNEAVDLSKSKLFTVSISGLRRVGKTRFILEILSKDDMYFFVNKDKESVSLLQEYAGVLKTWKILRRVERKNNVCRLETRQKKKTLRDFCTVIQREDKRVRFGAV
jgi:AAA+ ATPase superfamily predicted ATPase